MKTLFRLVVVLLLVAASGAFVVRDSAYWTPLEIQQGLDEKDPDRVERVFAFERFTASASQALGSIVADDMGLNGRDAGSQILKSLVNVFAKGVGEAVAKDAANDMRQAIREGRLERRIGPLLLNDGWEALGSVDKTIDGARLEVKGTCDSKPASVVLLLERYEDGLLGGHPHRYVVVGVDAESAKALVKTCNVK